MSPGCTRERLGPRRRGPVTGGFLLAGLPSPTTANRQPLRLAVSTGGQIDVRGFESGSVVRFAMSDTGSRIAIDGEIALLAGSTLAVGADTRSSFSGDLSFAQKTASPVNLDLALLGFSGACCRGSRSAVPGSARRAIVRVAEREQPLRQRRRAHRPRPRAHRARRLGCRSRAARPRWPAGRAKSRCALSGGVVTARRRRVAPDARPLQDASPVSTNGAQKNGCA